MDNTSFHFILGSQSPRRKELIGWLDIPYSIITSDVDEVSTSEDPQDFCEDIARLKGIDVWEQAKDKHENAFIVSADTMVFLDDLKLGKPQTREEARSMLLLLSNRTHQVITSVFMKTKDKEHTFSVSSDVTFDPIDERTLELYLDSRDSMDKAGAYGIQGKGLIFISYLKGSYSNVVGFPLATFKKELVKFVNVGNPWRKCFV
jgi:septum formation protein